MGAAISITAQTVFWNMNHREMLCVQLNGTRVLCSAGCCVQLNRTRVVYSADPTEKNSNYQELVQTCRCKTTTS
jgi:hypothetical protein